MKKIFVVVVAVFVVMMAASAFATVLNSKHDLSKGTTSTVGATTPSPLSACAFCHTPHNGATVTGAPLWNRSIRDTSNYQLYSNTATSYGAARTTLGANSKTCLSCHDGSIGLGNVSVGTDATSFVAIANRVLGNGLLDTANPAYIGTDLTNDHPVGFQVVASATAGLDSINNMKGKGARFYGAGLDEMECATCHDPHNTANIKFLRMDPSTICTDCHSTK